MKIRRRGARGESERGIALILTLLVLLILLAVVSQLTLSTRLDYQSAVTRATLARMDRALEAALADAVQVLKDDAEGGGGAADAFADLLGGAGGGAAGGAGSGGNPFAAAAGGARPPGGGDGKSSGGAAGAAAGDGEEGSADSLNDEWAKPARHTEQEIEVTVFIEDENRKFNLLSLLSTDEEYARQSRDRLLRILDTFREGTPYDVDLASAETLVRNLEAWLRGQERNDDFPRPPLLSNEENSAVTLPFTGDELLLLEGFDERLLYDFRAEDAIVPGLLSHVTVWTSLEVAPENAGVEGATSRARPSLAGPSGTGLATARPRAGSAVGPTAPPSGAAASEGGDAGRPATPGGGPGVAGGAAGGGGGTQIGAAINVNTAPRAVLASLLPSSEIPSETIEAILRFRNEPLETEESEEPTPEETLGLEEEAPPTKSFAKVEELDQIPEFGNLFPEVKQRFTALLTTQSEVFTIWLTARIPPAEAELDAFGGLGKPGWEEDRAGIARRVRAVVLRREGSDGVEVLPLLRWEVRADRRFPIPDFPEEILEELRR